MAKNASLERALQSIAHLGAAAKEIASPANMRKYGEMAAGMIRLRTRLGDGVSADGANKQKLKPLAPSTKKKRSGLAARGKLSSQTVPGKSNLTESGQMVDSVSVVEAKQGRVTVSPSGARTDGKTNSDVAGFVTDQGRPFNNLSRVENKRLSDQVKRDIRELAKKALTNG